MNRGEQSRWWRCWTFDGVGNTVDGGDVEDHMGGEGAGGFGGNGGKEGGASEFDPGFMVSRAFDAFVEASSSCFDSNSGILTSSIIK